MSATRVIGIGHLAGGDDAVGIHVIRALRDGDPGHAELIEVYDAAPLVELLLDVDHVILVDAAVSPDPPGTVRRRAIEDLGPDPRAATTHTLSVAQAVALGRVLGGDRACCHTDLVTITIRPPRNPSLSLSPVVHAAVPRAAAAVRALISDERPRVAHAVQTDPSDRESP